MDQDDLLLPHVQAEIDQYQKLLVEITPKQIRSLLTGYLAAHGEALNEYSRRQGIYYFDLPAQDGSKEHYGEVVFDREVAVKDDGLTFLHLNHPAVEQLLERLTQTTDPIISMIRLRPENPQMRLLLPGSQGIWAVYLLHVTNNVDVDRQEIIPVYVDDAGQGNARVAQLLLNLTPDQVDTAYQSVDENEISRLRDLTWGLAESQAGNRFSELQLEHSEQLDAERHKVEQYYRQQEGAIRQIAIENIRQGKQRELLERRRDDIGMLQRKIQLVPDLRLLGIAFINS